MAPSGEDKRLKRFLAVFACKTLRAGQFRFMLFNSVDLVTCVARSPVAQRHCGRGVCMDLQLVHNAKGGNITSHQSRIRHYFLLLPLPKSCLSPRYV